MVVLEIFKRIIIKKIMGYGTTRVTNKEKEARKKLERMEAAKRLKEQQEIKELFYAGRLSEIVEKYRKNQKWNYLRISDFFEGLRSYLEQNSKSRFPNEFDGTEYEIKLSLQKRLNYETARSALKSLNTGRKKHSFVSFGGIEGPWKTDICFYVFNEQELAIMHDSRNGVSLKQKKSLENLSYGLEGEDMIMKRREMMKRKCSQTEVYRAIEEAVINGYRFVGNMSRNRGRIVVLSLNSSRIFGLFYDECTLFPDAEKQSTKLQIEVEYIGYVKDYPSIALGSEREMAEELISLGNVVCECGKTIGINTKPTKDKKSDFLKC
jgi:hypothetical protein